jgi:hypothetical protein
MLGVKLQEVAERCVNELWSSPTVDYERLIKAMEAFKIASLMAMGSRRPRRHPDPKPRSGQDWRDRDAAIIKALKDLRWGGVNIEHIPEEAMALVEDAHTPPEDHPALRRGEEDKEIGANAALHPTPSLTTAATSTYVHL